MFSVIKEKYALSTDRGFNYIGVCLVAVNIAEKLESQLWQEIIVTLALLAMTIVAWLTRGSGISPSAGEVILDESSAQPSEEAIAEAIERARR